MNELSLKTFETEITARKADIIQYLGDKLNPDTFIKMLIDYSQTNPRVFECTKESIIKSVLDAAKLKLPIDTVLKKAYLLPFAKRCVLVPSYLGLKELALRSGYILNIRERAVKEKDEFTYIEGTKTRITHKPNIKEQSPIVAVYIIIDYVNGSQTVEVVPRYILDKLRDKSPDYNYYKRQSKLYEQGKAEYEPKTPISIEWEDDYFIAKALRYVLKRIPNLPEDFMNAIKIINDSETEDETEITVEPLKKEIVIQKREKLPPQSPQGEFLAMQKVEVKDEIPGIDAKQFVKENEVKPTTASKLDSETNSLLNTRQQIRRVANKLVEQTGIDKTKAEQLATVQINDPKLYIELKRDAKVTKTAAKDMTLEDFEAIHAQYMLFKGSN